MTRINDYMKYWYGKTATQKSEPCDDVVSRQAVLDEISKSVDHSLYAYKSLMECVKTLPSATQKSGKWIKGYTFPDGAYWKCNKCNELIKVKIPMRYCNNCGAKMESEEEQCGK